MAVVISEMDSTVETTSATGGTAAAAPTDGDLSEADFRQKYGDYVAAIFRDELERYLRSAAD